MHSPLSFSFTAAGHVKRSFTCFYKRRYNFVHSKKANWAENMCKCKTWILRASKTEAILEYSFGSILHCLAKFFGAPLFNLTDSLRMFKPEIRRVFRTVTNPNRASGMFEHSKLLQNTRALPQPLFKVEFFICIVSSLSIHKNERPYQFQTF